MAFLFVPAAARTAPETAAETQIAAPQTPNAQNLLAGLPSRFEPNVGQAADGIAYTLKAKGYLASLGASAIYFAFPEGKAPENPEDRLGSLKADPPPANRSVVTMSFPGANPDPVIEALDPQPGVSNYFLGNDPKNWHTEVPGYSKIYYRDLYDGIDMVIYDDRGQVRYDFIVAPGADPAQIAIAFEGAEGLKLSDTGDLVVSSPYGDLTHKAPFSYQENQEIESSFEVSGARVGFRLGAYDRTRELTIDPVLDYSSYLGGSSSDNINGISVDATGASHVVGQTSSSDFPVAGSPFQSSSAGSTDAYVTKFSADGSSLVFSSYLGGSANDDGRGITVDSAGATYVVGRTNSADFPVAGSPFQASISGGFDAFVAKVAADGQSLVYSGYLGGTSGDIAWAVALDSSGAAYVAGDTYSTNFPTASPFQAANAGGSEAFVSKVNASGSALVYSSYIGGSSDDGAYGVAADSSGAGYVTGSTQSTNFPTASPFQAANAGGFDAFVSKVNTSGSALAYSTYLGGTGAESGSGIAVDDSGSSVVSGSTASADFPTYSAYQPVHAGGGNDAFVTKLSASGASLAHSTYLGGSGDDDARAIALDQSGNTYVVGRSASADFPTEEPYQSTNAGSTDAYLTVFDGVDSLLLYSTYIGGTGDEAAASVAVDSAGVVHLAGFTDSTNFPMQDQYQGDQGGQDAFVVRHPPPVVTISGTFTGGMWGSVSIYSKTTGEAVAYQCCITDPSGYWSIKVPPSNCAAGRGYSILFLPPDNSSQARWYNDKSNFTSANCVRGPSTGNNMTIPSAGLISGYVKDASTAGDISGASVYAFKADGTFARGVSTDANGRYELNLSTSETYKLLVNPGTAYVNQWFSGAQGFAEATAQAVPATANFSVTPAGVIDGYVKDATTAADLNGYPVYAFTSAGTFFAYGVTDRGYGPGRYRINVNPGESYKLKSTGGPYSTQWFSGASSFSSATATAAPFTANFSRS